jgi:hypothetical protein
MDIISCFSEPAEINCVLLLVLVMLRHVHIVRRENAVKLYYRKECHFLINAFSCNCFFVFPLSLKYLRIIQPETNRMSARIKM